MRITSIFYLLVTMLLCSNSYAQTVTISASPSDTICSGTSVTFTATAVGSGTYGYIWKVNSTYVGTSSSTYSSATLANGDMVSCLLTNAAGDTIFALSDTITMTVNSMPVVNPITGIDSVCKGDSVRLSDLTPGGIWVSSNTTAATVSDSGWVTGLALPIGGAGPGGPSIRIFYIMSNSCGTDTARVRFYIRVPASPIISAGTSVCMDSTIVLLDSARGGSWLSLDTTIATFLPFPPGNNLVGVSPGTATILYSVSNICGNYLDSVQITVVNCDSATTSVKETASLAKSCSVFPNPSNGAFNVSVSSAKYSEVNCTISNMVGVKTKQLTLHTNVENTLDLGLPTGVYFMTISSGNEKYTTKLVIVQ